MFGKNPYQPEALAVLCCPKCGETEKINGRSLQYEILRTCGACGNQWSGGTMGSAKPDLASGGPPPAGVAAVDEDRPLEPDYSPGFRNNSYDFDSGEE